MKVIGIYHSKDLDGFCSGAIIKKKYPEAEMIGYDYGQDTDEIIEKVRSYKTDVKVIMADVSFPMMDMFMLGEIFQLLKSMNLI